MITAIYVLSASIVFLAMMGYLCVKMIINFAPSIIARTVHQYLPIVRNLIANRNIPDTSHTTGNAKLKCVICKNVCDQKSCGKYNCPWP